MSWMTAATPTPDNTADLARRLANLLRIGSIAEVDHAAARVRVQSGALLTDWLPWMAGRAGDVRSWSPPSIGEQVLLLAPSGELGEAVVLCGLYQDSAAAPSANGSADVRSYPDGAVISYDHGSGQLLASGVQSATMQASGSVTIDSPQTTITGQLTVQGQLVYQAGMSGTGGAGGTTISGPFIQSGGALSSNGVVLDTHTHHGDSGGTTGGPQ